MLTRIIPLLSYCLMRHPLNVHDNLGIWNPYEGGLKYWLYQIYWAYMMHVVSIMRMLTTLIRGINAEGSVQFVQEFASLAIEIANMITYGAFLLHRVDVLELSQAFNWERHLFGTREISEDVTKCNFT